jgi:hypothetical protein
MLEGKARNLEKHSSLSGPFVSYEEKMIYTFTPESICFCFGTMTLSKTMIYNDSQHNNKKM